MDILIFIILFAVLCGLCFRGSLMSGDPSNKHTHRRSTTKLGYAAFVRVEKLTYQGMEAKTQSTVSRRLEEARLVYDTYKDEMSDRDQQLLHDSIKDLHYTNAEMLEEQWNKKAFRYIEAMEEAYNTVLENDAVGYDQCVAARNRFLKAYDTYWDFTASFIEEHHDSVYRKQMWEQARSNIKDIFYESGVAFWGEPEASRHSVREQFVKILDKSIEERRPELVRRKAIMRQLTQHVREEDMIMRVELLKSIPDSDPKEVSACYKYLIQRKQLVEFKLETRYYVTLPDSKKRNRKPNQTPVIPSEDVDTPCNAAALNEILHYLQDNRYDYIDKTEKGGALYFFEQAAADELKKRGINVMHAPNGSRSTKNRPAWFVKASPGTSSTE